jgi:hypothetical protein
MLAVTVSSQIMGKPKVPGAARWARNRLGIDRRGWGTLRLRDSNLPQMTGSNRRAYPA